MKEKENKKGLLEVDELGRITIEFDRRKRHGIKAKDKFEIYVENDSIILKKLDILVEKEEIGQMKEMIKDDIEIDVKLNKIKETILNISDIGNYIRRIDEIGRIVIPIELRQLLSIFPHSKLEVDDRVGSISLTKRRK